MGKRFQDISGTLLSSRYLLINQLGTGAFGQVYAAKDTYSGEIVAIKLSLSSHQRLLYLESHIMTLLKGLSRQTIEEVEWNYLVMEKGGESLAQLRKANGGSFSWWTCLYVMKECIRALECLHSVGYVHRDVKGSNFLVEGEKLKLIDFGLSRRIINSDGTLRKEREQIGFRGTTRYASLRAHECKELGRCDDLVSMFYVVLEMYSGSLPWAKVEKEFVYNLKIQHSLVKLAKGLPVAFHEMIRYVNSLCYGDEPNYAYLLGRVEDMIGREMPRKLEWLKVEENVMASVGAHPTPPNGPKRFFLNARYRRYR